MKRSLFRATTIIVAFFFVFIGCGVKTSENTDNLEELFEGLGKDPFSVILTSSDGCGGFLLSSEYEEDYAPSPYYNERAIPEDEWVVQDPEIKSEWKAIEQTMSMYQGSDAQRLASLHGFQILPITWEDTGRFKDSAVGPNISDMTIQLRALNPRSDKYEVGAMPVIRYPNFSDLTTDVDPRDFGLWVGNQNGADLQRISLHEFLASPTSFLSRPESWGSEIKSLLAERDTKVLVSAQAAFLPVPKKGKTSFNPVLFNYQSTEDRPAVLTILATREGTSVTVIDNVRDAWSDGAIWGQRLFHNMKGEKASFVAEREEDFVPEPGALPPPGARLNMVLLIQVPLKQAPRSYTSDVYDYQPEAQDCTCCTDASEKMAYAKSSESMDADVSNAVIGHGEAEGMFTEIDDLKIERDPDFPVRVTVQFYKATETGVMSVADMEAINADISSVYAMGSVVGSLVTGGKTGRVTEYAGVKVQPEGWWNDFWARHQANTGETPEQARARLVSLFGTDYQNQPVSDFYLRRVLAP